MNVNDNKPENLTVVAPLNDKLLMQVQLGDHLIIADEPVESGGEGKGPDPYELLSASLATCTLATLQLYLKRKDWPVKILSVEVSFSEKVVAGVRAAHFVKHIKVAGTLDEVQKNRLLFISDACPVSKILKSSDNKIDSIVLLSQ